MKYFGKLHHGGQQQSIGRPQSKLAGRQIELATNRHRVTPYVNSPSGVDPIDNSRDASLGLPGRGRYRAVFNLIPDKNADDPYAIRPRDPWDVRVRWHDPTTLFVPALNDDSVLAATKYIIDNSKQGNAFENEVEVRMLDPQ